MNKPPRFILLDDDPISLALTEQIIRNTIRYVEIITFPAAKEVLAFMEKDDCLNKDPDTVLVTDLHMPEMDGFSLLQQIESRFGDSMEKLHIFVLSADADPYEVRTVFSYRSVIGFYGKPLTTENVKDILQCVQYRF